jgi:hypothetical protein
LSGDGGRPYGYRFARNTGINDEFPEIEESAAHVLGGICRRNVEESCSIDELTQ